MLDEFSIFFDCAECENSGRCLSIPGLAILPKPSYHGIRTSNFFEKRLDSQPHTEYQLLNISSSNFSR